MPTNTNWCRSVTSELHRIFYTTRFGRTLDRLGYDRFRHWRLYGEQGLANTSVAVWLFGEYLTVEVADEPLAQYHVHYAPDQHHMCGVEVRELYTGNRNGRPRRLLCRRGPSSIGRPVSGYRPSHVRPTRSRRIAARVPSISKQSR